MVSIAGSKKLKRQIAPHSGELPEKVRDL